MDVKRKMIFEEQFPGLKGKGILRFEDLQTRSSTEGITLPNHVWIANSHPDYDKLFLRKDIQDKCLDKQIVKEAIDRELDDEIINRNSLFRLKKELGLE